MRMHQQKPSLKWTSGNKILFLSVSMFNVHFPILTTIPMTASCYLFFGHCSQVMTQELVLRRAIFGPQNNTASFSLLENITDCAHCDT